MALPMFLLFVLFVLLMNHINLLNFSEHLFSFYFSTYVRLLQVFSETFRNLTFYPDFTLRQPGTGEFIYWEHFGMMDSPGYRQKAGRKLDQYISQGLIPNMNLITTYETSDRPLSPVEIEELIARFFP